MVLNNPHQQEAKDENMSVDTDIEMQNINEIIEITTMNGNTSEQLAIGRNNQEIKHKLNDADTKSPL